MAFDKNNTSLGMKIIIIVFAVVLVLSLCLPFFSSCTAVTTSSSSSDAETTTTTTSTTSSTVADVKSTYSTLVSSLESKLEADPTNAAASASLGNAYMDMAMAMDSATDASDYADEINEVFAQAVACYDTYLETTFSNAVAVDRTVCLFYGGNEDEAIEDLTAFLDEHDDYAMGWYNLGVFYYTEGEYELAEEAYNKAIEADPDDETGANTYAQNGLIWVQYLESIIVTTDDDATDDDAEAEDSSDDAEVEDADAAADADAEETDGDADAEN
jgi:tetratricopeptide (TPR) repeat protein